MGTPPAAGAASEGVQILVAPGPLRALADRAVERHLQAFHFDIVRIADLDVERRVLHHRGAVRRLGDPDLGRHGVRLGGDDLRREARRAGGVGRHNREPRVARGPAHRHAHLGRPLHRIAGRDLIVVELLDGDDLPGRPGADLHRVGRRIREKLLRVLRIDDRQTRDAQWLRRPRSGRQIDGHFVSHDRVREREIDRAHGRHEIDFAMPLRIRGGKCGRVRASL